MKLEWKTKSFALTGLDPFTAELLRRLPGCAGTDDDVARRRIFPAPTGGKEEDTDTDWHENVEPELREIFASHIAVVEADLAKMRAGDEGEALRIPQAHGPAWIHTLNQARLALGARHNITEDHMNGEEFPENQQDALAVLQVDFYGAILAFLLRHTEL
jgi:hypothetical protein